jgi:hypothetical protein
VRTAADAAAHECHTRPSAGVRHVCVWGGVGVGVWACGVLYSACVACRGS